MAASSKVSFPRQDEGAPTRDMVAAAHALLASVDAEQRRELTHPIDSQVWRAWMNPELYLNRYGLRLDEVDETVRAAALELVAASLSPAGFQKVRDCMRTNEFLGTLIKGPKIVNEYSYNINIFGIPSVDEPWGWSFYGHHLCLSALVIGSQLVVSPVFFGAEPNLIDEGPHRGIQLFQDQDRTALKLLRGLPADLRDEAVLFPSKTHPALPEGRSVFGDELHLGGMFQDNRIIPYEGVNVGRFDETARSELFELVSQFVNYLPDGSFRARMRSVHEHVDETWFCWIGGWGDDDPFYFRIQSPVIMVEYEHHAGILLANVEPAKFHTHTIVRTPNGNDYGTSLVVQHLGRSIALAGPVHDDPACRSLRAVRGSSRTR